MNMYFFILSENPPLITRWFKSSDTYNEVNFWSPEVCGPRNLVVCNWWFRLYILYKFAALKSLFFFFFHSLLEVHMWQFTYTWKAHPFIFTFPYTFSRQRISSSPQGLIHIPYTGPGSEHLEAWLERNKPIKGCQHGKCKGDCIMWSINPHGAKKKKKEKNALNLQQYGKLCKSSQKREVTQLVGRSTTKSCQWYMLHR